jgi:hypothetical protein
MSKQSEAIAKIRTAINDALDAIEAGAENYHIFFGVQQVVGKTEESLSIQGEMGILGNPEIAASGLVKLALQNDLRERALSDFVDALLGNVSNNCETVKEEVNVVIH